jgi:hemerythrin-like metal-binding protein
MALVEWSDDFKLGEAEIDWEHWWLFALINDLSYKHAQGAGDASITSAIDALAAYVDVHLEHEERLMRAVGCPKLDSHIELHVALARRVEEY